MRSAGVKVKLYTEILAEVRNGSADYFSVDCFSRTRIRQGSKLTVPKKQGDALVPSDAPPRNYFSFIFGVLGDKRDEIRQGVILENDQVRPSAPIEFCDPYDPCHRIKSKNVLHTLLQG